MPPSLDRLYRAFGAALFLSVIGVGGSLLAMTVFPAITLATRDPERRRCRIQQVLHQSFKLYCRAIHVMGFAEVRMEGLEKLKDLKGVMLIANHPSLLDVVMIMAAVPNVQCVVKGGLWRNPFFRLTVEGAGYIRNDLEPALLMEACVATLKAGNNLIVFPEGTRTTPGKPVKMQRGFATIALAAMADLQIIRITVDPPLLHKGAPWWRMPEKRTHFHLRVCDRLDIARFVGYRFRSQSTRRLVAFLENFYAGSSDHALTGTGDQTTDRLGAATGGLVA